MKTKPIQPATPLPWREGPASTPNANALGIRGIWTQDKRTGVGEAYGPRENAAYIVEACNAYPRLLAERAELAAALQRSQAALRANDLGNVEAAKEASALLERIKP